MTTSNAGAAEVFGDIGSVFRQLMTDPVGKIGAAFSSLSVNRAQLVGLVLCAAFALVMALGVTVGTSSFFGMLGSLGFGESAITRFFQSTLQYLVMAAAMVGISFGIRKLAGSKHPLAHDAFIVGVAVIPIAICALLAGLLASVQLALLLGLLGISFAILILYSGLTTISGLATRTASFAVPLIIAGGIWVSGRVIALFW